MDETQLVCIGSESNNWKILVFDFARDSPFCVSDEEMLESGDLSPRRQQVPFHVHFGYKETIMLQRLRQNLSKFSDKMNASGYFCKCHEIYLARQVQSSKTSQFLKWTFVFSTCAYALFTAVRLLEKA
jgi:hypothetical protein